MKILITGSSGLVGSALIPMLEKRGDEVVRLVRKREDLGNGTLLWDPEHENPDKEAFEGYDGLINLAGENIASGRWTEEKKKKIDKSRGLRTHMLTEFLARLDASPKWMLSASAIGYYGSRGDEKLTEESAPGEGFLAEVCKKWESATDPLAEKGARVVNLRFGVILSPQGGALSKMLLPFKFGVGGKIGDGAQYMSWVDIEDLKGIVEFCLDHETISGPVNVTAPHTVTNREFTKILGKVLNRPAIFPLPAFLAKLMMGEMADEMLLASTRAVPRKLEELGYAFRYPELEQSLKHLLH